MTEREFKLECSECGFDMVQGALGDTAYCPKCGHETRLAGGIFPTDWAGPTATTPGGNMPTLYASNISCFLDGEPSFWRCQFCKRLNTPASLECVHCGAPPPEKSTSQEQDDKAMYKPDEDCIDTISM